MNYTPLVPATVLPTVTLLNPWPSPKALRRPNPPAALAGLFDSDLYPKTQAYSLDKWCAIGGSCTAGT